MNAMVCNTSTELSFGTFSQLKGKKIIFVIDEMASITAGGTERQLLQLVELASAAGLSPEILVFRNTKWLTPEVAGCPVHYRNLEKLFDPRGIRELVNIARWMRSQRFDILQTFFADANVIGPLLGKAAGIPYILTSRRNLNYSMTPGRLVAQRLANRLTTGIVANCEAVRKAVTLSEKPDPNKIHVVYNGIDLRSFTPCPTTHSKIRSELGVTPHEVLIGCVSAVRSIKGVHHLVGAATQVLPKASNARFCVVGDGEDLAELRKITDSDELLAKRFFWVGAREDVKPYLRAFDIAVLPSLSEGFSNSILEYMAMGLPVVATDVGGNREALEDGAGILVPPGDEPALAQALEHLLASPTERMSMSFRAAERVRRWDLEVALHENASYYAQLLNTSPQ
jgi:L-malate glycosyltransferase